MTGLTRQSDTAIKRGANMADLWLDVEKKLEGSPKLCEVYNIAKKEHLKEYMDKISRNEMATGSRRILDNISKFVDKYAPIAEIIKSMDDRHHNAQLGYGIFTLLWLVRYCEANPTFVLRSLIDYR